MATKPVITPFVWATDVNFTTGPAPLIGTPTKLTTPSATIDEGWVADQTPPVQWFNFNFNHTTQWTNWVSFGSSAGAADAHIVETDGAGISRLAGLEVGGVPVSAGLGVFGSGDDGNVTLGGGVTQLTRDMAYNNLTVPAGSTLENLGFRIFVRETLTLRGVIASTGDDGGPGIGGGENGSGTSNINTLGRGGQLGGDGEANGNGNPGVPGFFLQGGNGGTGGNAGAFTGGAPSVFNAGSTIIGTIETIHSALGFHMMHNSNDIPLGKIGGGSSGGGGAGDGIEGGGGGGAGGVICIWANVFDSDGTVEADGGDGADSATSGSGTDGGGGGGAGGGVIFMVRRTTGPLGSGTFSVAAGSGGAGFGAGTAGDAGVVGKILQFVT